MDAIADDRQPCIVLLVEVTGAPAVADFHAARDRKLARLTELHRDAAAADYTVTAWNEFRSVLLQAEQLPRVIFDIRRVLAPWEVYIGAGFGEVTGARSPQPVGQSPGGEGAERARAAMQALKAGRGDKYRRLTRVLSGDDERDRLLNLVYALHDTLLQQVTGRQWETINAVVENGAAKTQEEVAAELDVQPSTVTRNLRRAHYWQMRETIRIVAGLLAGEPPGSSLRPARPGAAR